ncbi:MAG TPA: MlaD family protein [Stellaceae bacterium]|jgi:phospholipid/cholesterol/gamma-HCH transport system substrate-binding protein|nr:MlaD family protein [Stellaceae bacterium]
METRAHYVAIGAFVLTMVALAFVAVMWLARAELTTQYAHYDIYFTGPVTGLRTGAPVEYNGVPVGRVTTVEIDPADVERIRVTAELDQKTLIKTDARASVETNILSGVSYIQIVGGTREAKVLTAEGGERYPVIRSHRSRLASVTARAPELLDKLNRTADRLNAMLSEKNEKSVTETLDNLREFSEVLVAGKDNIKQFTEHANAAAAGLSGLVADIDRSYSGPGGLSSKLSGAIGDFDKVARNLSDTNRQLQKTVADVQPGLRTFSQQTLGQAGSLIGEARQLIAGLNQLTAEIARDPSRMLFGDRRVGYQPK